MTRETKIGLLVGLAFIIVIGILLSDHMTSTTQPQQALLTDAGANVRESVMPPASAQGAAPRVATGGQITPSDVVRTRSELNPPPAPPPLQAQPPAVERVQVGGPTGIPGIDPIVIRQSGGAPVVREPVEPASQVMSDVLPPGAMAGSSPAVDEAAELQRWAGVGHQPADPVAPAPPVVERVEPGPVTPPAAAARTDDGREYVAQAGDNLSKLASRMLGSNSKAHREAIVRANPSLQRNPDLVIEGRKYKAPSRVDSPAAPAAPPALVPVTHSGGTSDIPETVPVVRRTAPVPVTELVEPLPAARNSTRIYVAKENDNLWRIAAEQLGSGNAWTQIKAMNKDVLKGGETVLPNMRLRLPARPVASAAN